MPCETRVSGIRLTERAVVQRAASHLGMTVDARGRVYEGSIYIGEIQSNGDCYAYQRRGMERLQQEYSKTLVSEELGKAGFSLTTEVINPQTQVMEIILEAF